MTLVPIATIAVPDVSPRNSVVVVCACMCACLCACMCAFACVYLCFVDFVVKQKIHQDSP